VSTFEAVCFDLDGTLVETEELKSRSYAAAVTDLRPDVTIDAVLAAYEDLVGRPREAVVAELMHRFGLEAPARRRLAELGAATPADAFALLRLQSYEAMIADSEVVRRQAYPCALALLHDMKREGWRTGLATMSHAAQAIPVLEIIGARSALDVVVTRDEVERAKPDPQIYLVLAERLGVRAERCLTIEDSVPGIQSALAAGMTCVAMTTRMTRAAVHAAGILPAERIVDDPDVLERVVRGLLSA
jgi:beta-phosphoglucomutase